MVALRMPIPKEIREKLSESLFMSRCCLEDETCHGRIQFHHHLTYAGRRQNTLYSILPLCAFHHRTEAVHRLELNAVMRARIRHFNAEDSFRIAYPRSNLLPSLKSE